MYIISRGVIAGSVHTVLRLLAFDPVQRQGNGLHDLKAPLSRWMQGSPVPPAQSEAQELFLVVPSGRQSPGTGGRRPGFSLVPCVGSCRVLWASLVGGHQPIKEGALEQESAACT